MRELVGTRLPTLNLVDHNGSPFEFGSVTEHWLLLWWFPKANTPGCTAEAQRLRDQASEFAQFDCQIIGASFDAPEDNERFRADHHLPFPLLSDATRAAALALGVTDDAAAPHPRRMSFLIDPAGTIRVVYEVDDPMGHPDIVLDDLERLQAHERPSG